VQSNECEGNKSMTLRDLESIAHCLAILRGMLGLIPHAPTWRVLERAEVATRKAIREMREER